MPFHTPVSQKYVTPDVGKVGLYIFTTGDTVKHSNTFRNMVIYSKSFGSMYTLLHVNSTRKYLS